MSEPHRPVIVFHGSNEFEAQLARDVLTAAGIPVLHLPSLSTGIFGSPTTPRVAVPEDYMAAAVEVLEEAGLSPRVEDRARGLDEFRETFQERFPLGRASPLPRGSRLGRVLLLLAVIIVVLFWLGYFRGR